MADFHFWYLLYSMAIKLRRHLEGGKRFLKETKKRFRIPKKIFLILFVKMGELL